MAIDPGIESFARGLFRSDRYSCPMALVFAIFAIPLAIIDIRERRIPDWILLAEVVILVVLDVMADGVDIPALTAAAMTALAMVGAGRFSRSGMGLGDVKMGTVGAFALGPLGGWIMLSIAAILGIAFGLACTRGRRIRKKIPFAPFLAIGTVCAIGIRSTAFPVLP